MRRRSRGAAGAEPVDVDLVRLGREPVASAELLVVGGGAELGLLDGAACRADEMVVVPGPAADVRGPLVARERPDGAAAAQQLDGAVGGREAEGRVRLACAVEEPDDGKAAVPGLDCVQDGAPR